MTSCPILSIVMPSRNRGHLLTRTLAALDRQEDVRGGDFELIVVLDGDESGAAAVLGRAVTRFPIRVLEQPGSGAAGARNRGWREARAELVLFLDDDMEAAPRLVAEHIAASRLHPDAALVGRFSPDRTQRPSAWSAYETDVHEKRQHSYLEGEELSGIRCYTGNLAVPRALLEKVGGFDVSLRRNEDVDLGYRLQAAGARLVFVSQAACVHTGGHPFQAWRRSARAYGELEVALFRDRGYSGGLLDSVANFHDRRRLTRGAVRASLVHPVAATALVQAARAVGLTAHRFGARSAAYAAMSAISNIEFWGGVAATLGPRRFVSLVDQTRGHQARTYDRRAASRAG